MIVAKKEVKTDLWVYDLLKQADIQLDAQGSDIKEINEAVFIPASYFKEIW